MPGIAFESRQRLLKMWSVRVQAAWAVACGVFVGLPEHQQTALIGMLGVVGEGGVAAAVFAAQVSMAVSAATIAARAAKQPELQDQ